MFVRVSDAVTYFVPKLQSPLLLTNLSYKFELTAPNKYKKMKRYIYIEYQFLMNDRRTDKMLRTSSTAPSVG